MSNHDHRHHHHPAHGSLAADIETMLNMPASRRQSLRWLFAASALPMPLIGCGGSGAETGSIDTGLLTNVPAQSESASSGACSVIPEETAGPYPADGSNRNAAGVVNALILAGVVRSDIRASFAGAGGVALGVSLTIRLQLVNVKSSCTPLAGATVYLWHCDREGRYSMYTAGVTAENYLRGVQEADASGVITFQTIFPGCYDGRMPHVHFEVYPTLASATSAANRIKTSQFGFPSATLTEAYGASGYASSVSNLSRISYATDNVFSDGTSLQIASMSGTAAQGYTATLTVGVSL